MNDGNDLREESEAACEPLGTEGPESGPPAPCPPVAGSPAPETPARRRGGQPSNGNALKTAWRAKLPKLSKSAKAAEDQVYGLRRALLASLGREPTLAEQLLVQSICRAEVIVQNCFAWLRREGDAMPLADRLQVTAVLSRAEESRSKLIAKLGLKHKSAAGGSVWDALTDVDEGAA